MGEAQQGVQQGRLARARGAHEGDRLAGGEGEAGLGEGVVCAALVAYGQAVDRDGGRAQVGCRGLPLWGERGLQDGEDLVGGGESFGGGVVVDAYLPEREVRLGGQDQDEEAGTEVEFAVYPADTLTQAKAFYRQHSAVAGVGSLRSRPEW